MTRRAPRRHAATVIAGTVTVLGLVALVAGCGTSAADQASTTPSVVTSTAVTVSESETTLRDPQPTTDSDPADTTVPAPPGDLYAPPDPLEPAPPGTLIWAEVVDLDFFVPSTVWRMLYHSRSVDDQDIAVSGFAVIPNALPASGVRQVYAWGHGTVGLGDQCAPSRDIRENLPPYGGQQLERGAILVATDYEGLGTPGIPTSTVAVAEAHALLDSIRAVAALPGAGSIGDVVVAGHSQGGRAALSAAELAPSYAPDLQLVGAIALAAGVELPSLADSMISSPFVGVVVISAIGLRAGYPDLDLSTVFTDGVIADIARVETECVDATVSRYAAMAASDIIAHDPNTVPEVHALLAQNSPGLVAPAVPVFVAIGDSDEQIPVVLTKALMDQYCSLGVSITRQVYPGEGHDSLVDAAAEDAMDFITSRYAHESATSTCP